MGSTLLMRKGSMMVRGMVSSPFNHTPFGEPMSVTGITRLVRKSEAQGYIRLELSGVIVLAVGLVAPVADGFAEGADAGNRTVFGYLNFQDYVAGAVSGQGVRRILGLCAAEEVGFSLRGRKPDALGIGDFCGRGCCHDGIAIGLGWSGLHPVNDFAFFGDD